jgi:hypothetical protein
MFEIQTTLHSKAHGKWDLAGGVKVMFTFMQRVSRRKLAGTGFVLLAAPSYFVAAAILKYGFGVGLFFDPLAVFFADPQRLRFLNLVLTPVLFFGGSLLALALNLYAILRRRAENGPRPMLSNILAVLVSFSLLVAITTYGYLENFTRR